MKVNGSELNYPLFDKNGKLGVVKEYRRRYVNQRNFVVKEGKLKLSAKEKRYHVKALWRGRGGCLFSCQPLAGKTVEIVLSWIRKEEEGKEWSTSDKQGVVEFYAEDKKGGGRR